MQGVPVVAIGIVGAVSRPVSAEAMQGVLMQSVRANVFVGADVAAAEAPHVLAAKAADVASTAEASDVISTAKAATHMAAATAKTSAVTTTTAATAGVGRAC